MIDPKLITWGTGREIDMDLLERTWNEVSPMLIGEMCDKETRAILKAELEKRLPDYTIKCNEENNPPCVIDNQNIMVRVSKIVNGTRFYVDLIF